MKLVDKHLDSGPSEPDTRYEEIDQGLGSRLDEVRGRPAAEVSVTIDETDRLRAIDLYSGIGGWALGLRMAETEVVGSYEWWGPANATHVLNFPEAPVHEVDIRALDPGAASRVSILSLGALHAPSSHSRTGVETATSPTA